MGKKNENQEKEKINIKDIHETYWRCRDFELANLWQRSIFLTAFLVLCFTAYGTLGVKLVDDNSNSLLINIALSFIAFLGLIFSILWIKMGKGSKAWYEVYESAITAMEINTKFSTEDASKIGGFYYNKIPEYKGVSIKNSIFSNKAGEYSVSRINIAIGQVFMFFWFILFTFNLISIGNLLFSITETSNCQLFIYFFIMFSSILIIFLFAWDYSFVSGALKDKKQKE